MKALDTGIDTCATCPIHDMSCWRLLDREDRAFLNEYRVDSVFAPGQVVFHESHPCHGLHCVASGLLALRKSDSYGNSVILRLVHTGETLGYPAHFGGMEYTASAEALRESRVCFFPGRAVAEIIKRNPAMQQEFLRLLALELRGYGEARLRFATLPLHSRLFEILLDLLSSCGRISDDSKQAELQLPISRRDLAAMLGVRPETVARALRQISENGMARFDGRKVLIPDLRRMKRECRTI